MPASFLAFIATSYSISLSVSSFEKLINYD